MNDMQLLLNITTTNEAKYEAANNIIKNYELCLYDTQIILAFEKVLNWLYTNDKIKLQLEFYKYRRLYLFNELLNINKNMFIAIILALCDNFCPEDLYHFITSVEGIIKVGMDRHITNEKIKSFCILLDYYEFDVNDIEDMPENAKEKIQDYRIEKYSGKMIKCAIKNE